MKNWLCLGLILLSFTQCKNKQKNNLATNAPGELNHAYKKLKLPFYAVDSAINEKGADTTISLDEFTQYFPDSIFNKPFGKERNLTLRPVGKIEQRGKESYYATLAVGKNKSAIYLSVYDSNHHIVTMPILIKDKDSTHAVHSASIDKKLTIVMNKEWIVKNDLYYNRIIFAYNNVGIFTTVLTETNEQRRTDVTLVNPLDTFPKRNKFSGDYGKGSKNHLFIRDGGMVNEYLFFVHFQNDDKDDPCSGELKGKFKIIQNNIGQFAATGDPCALSFTFKNEEVLVKENGNCGNYRDIKCVFNDTYTKVKEQRKIAGKK